MKTTLLASCLLAIICTSVYGRYIENDVNDAPSFIDTLIRKALEYVRTVIKDQGFYTVPYTVNDHFVDSDFDIQLKLSQMQISQADDFVVNKIHNDITKLAAEFDLGFPNPLFSADYEISGTFMGLAVQGTGKAKANLKNFDVKGGFQMEVADRALSMDSLLLDYTLDSASVAIDHIKVQGMTEKQVEDFLNTKLLDSLNKNKEAVCSKISDQVKMVANQILKGKNIMQIIDWLNHLIHH